MIYRCSNNIGLVSSGDSLTPPRLCNTGLVSSGASLTSWEEGASLALVGHPSSDGVTIKIPYMVDVFLLGWLKLNLALLLDQLRLA